MSFDVRVPDDALLGQSVDFQPQLTWTSLPGVVPGERTGDASVDPSNDYLVTASTPVTIDGLLTLTATLASSSSTLTSGRQLALGEQANLRVTVDLPEGRGAVAVRVTPPAGFALDSLTVDQAGFAGTTTLDPSSPALGGTAGQSFLFDLGQVDNPGDNLAANDVLVLELQGRTVASAAAGTDTATAAGEVAGAEVGSAQTEIEVLRPRLGLTLTDDGLRRSGGPAGASNGGPSPPAPAGLPLARRALDSSSAPA